MSASTTNYYQLAKNIKIWGQELGFQQVGISDIDLTKHEDKFQQWLDKNYHGEMEFMARHGTKRTRPSELLPGTVSIVSVRLNYLPADAKFAATLEDDNLAFISRYALGRDYHKLVRNKLKKLGQKIAAEIGNETLNFRPFVDSAPVLERPIAEKAGLGWVGKHSLIINEEAGSWFFLGELFLPLPLPADMPVEEQCGKCVACITTCPTGAIVEPYVVDSRKCISYLTIELKGSIPIEYRRAMGNRIYGCDDCQLICPWTRQGQLTNEDDFTPRAQLTAKSLLALWQWTESEFLKNTEGSPIRRIGFESWSRNIAIALGNAAFSLTIVNALQQKQNQISDLVDEHIDWALAEQQLKFDKLNGKTDEKPRKLQRLIKAIDIGLPRDAR
ncbi:tRNA epoxyqueuosine(34) reductase QueG [Psychrosphaera sp. B3R10]|uniref:tRNA epoxyqueuosine(34) reductase QueG n=1 Tax=Psychrosphaera sp. B3R10 TaxID=2841569 RepID=UPI00352C1AB4